jgi:hypothetical protein
MEYDSSDRTAPVAQGRSSTEPAQSSRTAIRLALRAALVLQVTVFLFVFASLDALFALIMIVVAVCAMHKPRTGRPRDTPAASGLTAETDHEAASGLEEQPHTEPCPECGALNTGGEICGACVRKAQEYVASEEYE